LRLSERGLIAEICQRGRPAPLNATKRWVIERANSWQAKRAHGKRQPPPANAGSHYFATFSNTQVIVKITHLRDVRNPTSVVILCLLRSVRGEGLARILPPPPGLGEECLLRKEVKRWPFQKWKVIVDVDVAIVGARDAVTARTPAGHAGVVNASAAAAAAVR
jgi:hypothetical protein